MSSILVSLCVNLFSSFDVCFVNHLLAEVVNSNVGMLNCKNDDFNFSNEDDIKLLHQLFAGYLSLLNIFAINIASPARFKMFSLYLGLT